MANHPRPIILAEGRTSGNINVPILVDDDGTVHTTGSGGGGGAVTISNGSDTAEGSTTDAAVVGDNTGTVSAKLRGLSKIFADVWDSVNHVLKVSGSFILSTSVATTSTLSNVASSATSVTLLALNTARLAAVIYNDSTQVLYVKFGATASETSYTYQLPSGGALELPNFPVYTGRIDGIWASANGNARVTEVTA